MRRLSEAERPICVAQVGVGGANLRHQVYTGAHGIIPNGICAPFPGERINKQKLSPAQVPEGCGTPVTVYPTIDPLA